jgi:hypothetical protein
MATASPTVVALVSGYLGLKGESIKVLEGEVYDRNHPLVKQYPHLFGPQASRSAAVETATAGPGEKRGA